MAISKAILLKCLNPCTFFAPGTVGAAVEANGCRNYFMNKLAHNLVIIYICNWNIMHAYMYVLLTWLAQWPWLRINLKPIWPGNLNTSDRGLHHNDRRLGGIGRVVPIVHDRWSGGIGRVVPIDDRAGFGPITTKVCVDLFLLVK